MEYALVSASCTSLQFVAASLQVLAASFSSLQFAAAVPRRLVIPRLTLVEALLARTFPPAFRALYEISNGGSYLKGT